MASAPLVELESLLKAWGRDAAARKLEALRALRTRRLASAAEVLRLHEALLFLLAYADDAAVRRDVRALLQAFGARADLARHRAALAGSGIAGTAIAERFFAEPAQWLAARWPAQLRLDRGDAEAGDNIARALKLLVTRAEAEALVERRPEGYDALDRVRGSEPDAVFLLRRIARLPGDTFTREAFSDAIDASFVLEPGPGTPSRTLAFCAAAPRLARAAPPVRARPDLRAECGRAPRLMKRLGRAAGLEAVELARGAMVTRSRALEAFSYADARDAWLVDDGAGLAFTCVGMQPERRQALAASYAGLTLRNGVPIGYWQADIVGPAAALSFNTFDTFRGGEAAHTLARLLAALVHGFGCASFSFEPYQLGHGNAEGLASGAWWFYAKLGFAPRDPATLALARAEAGRVQRRPRHRTRPALLARLARQHLFFDVDPARPHPLPPLGALGLAAAARLSARHGADREAALEACSRELAARAGLASLAPALDPDGRRAWLRLVPLFSLIDSKGWSADECRALVDLARAKGGPSERDFIARYQAHPRLDAALHAAAADAATTSDTA